MDSITQFVLGASVGEAVLGKKVGNKALLWGGIAGTIPDLDIFANIFLNDFQTLLFHRGLTHSLLFGLLISPFLAWCLNKIYKSNDTTYQDWLFLFLCCIISHPLLDFFTNYGTQFFYPFSDYRISFNTIFVIDPLYTLPLLGGCILILFHKNDLHKRRRINRIALLLSSAYLTFTCFNKMYVQREVVAKLDKQNISYEALMTTPAPLNNILWSVIVKGEEGFYVGYYSLLDKADSLTLFSLPSNKPLLGSYLPNEKIEQLIDFSKGFYALEKTDKGLIFNDLRFSTVSGWFNVQDEYVFSFLIQNKGGDIEIFRKEPEENLKLESFKKLGKRIMGNNPKIDE